MHTWATFFFITNPINTNLIHFIPVLNFLSHTGCYSVRIGPSRTFAVSLFKISLFRMVFSLFRIALSLFRSLALPPIRCFASPFRSFVSPFHSHAWPFRSFAVSLFRNLALSLFRGFVVSPIRCFAISPYIFFEISLFRTLVVSTSNISYLFCFALSLFRTFVVSNSDVMVKATVCRAVIYFSADTLMWCLTLPSVAPGLTF